MTTEATDANAPRSLNPEMLALAREARGLSQAQLAADLRWSQGKLSKCENGLLALPVPDLQALADRLRYPVAFFQHAEHPIGFATCCLYHRKRQSLPVRVLNTLHAQVNIRRINVARLLGAREFHHEFCRMDIDEYDGSPETVAQLLRATWKLPLGPIKNLVRVVEDVGGIVVSCRFDTGKLDAVSQWPPRMPPLFFVNDRIPTDRSRWTLAHEIGHIVMHTIPTPDAEREADRFASEFLMPSCDIASELDGMSIAKAAGLKPRWRVSMQSLIRRARDLGRITDRKYRSLCQAIGKLGYRKQEPVRLQPEQPRCLRTLINTYLTEFKYSPTQLSDLMLLSEEEFRREYLSHANPNLRVID
jgi:Zn-dependent peptidase ImmA (M78 family)